MSILLINDKYKYIIVTYRKSGCSTVRLLHLYLTYPELKNNLNFEDMYHDFTGDPNDTNKIIQDPKYLSYFKVVIYRDPYERLCSAYFQFIVGISGNNNMRDGNILHLDSRRPREVDKVSTFSNWLQWIIYEDGINFDHHYYPQKMPSVYNKVVNLFDIDTIFDTYSDELSKIVKIHMMDSRKKKLNFLPKQTNDITQEYQDLSNYNFITDQEKILINGIVPPYEYLLTPTIKNFIKENYKDDFL